MNNRATPEDDLVNELMKPMRNLQFARWGEDLDTPMGKSCRTRANNARAEIREAVRKYNVRTVFNRE